MNDKILQKLLKILNKTQAEKIVLTPIIPVIETPLPSIGCCCYNHQQYVDDSISNRIDARMWDPRCSVFLTTMAECGRRKGVFYKGFSCNTYEGDGIHPDVRTVDNSTYGEPPESPGGSSSFQFSCCNFPPPTDTSGGQFVPVEA